MRGHIEMDIYEASLCSGAELNLSFPSSLLHISLLLERSPLGVRHLGVRHLALRVLTDSECIFWPLDWILSAECFDLSAVLKSPK